MTMGYGMEVTAVLHDAAHSIRRVVRSGLDAGLAWTAIEDAVDRELARAVSRVARLERPCGSLYAIVPGGAAQRRCEKPADHVGEHGGNL